MGESCPELGAATPWGLRPRLAGGVRGDAPRRAPPSVCRALGTTRWGGAPPGGLTAGADSLLFCSCLGPEAGTGAQLVGAVTLSQAWSVFGTF